MKELTPLTISNSLLGNPTVLLTDDLESYTLYKPLDDHLRATNEVLDFLYRHFKVNRLKVGVFVLKGKKYYCYQERDGKIEFNSWNSFLWDSKRKFNQFLSPKSLFYSYLIELYFPFFKGSKKCFFPERKNQFIVHPVPNNNFASLSFCPTSPAKLGLTKGGVKSFFKYLKKDLVLHLEDFDALHHEKLKADLKYRISLYPEIRNQYWQEVQQCFDPEFKNYTRAELENYILKL